MRTLAIFGILLFALAAATPPAKLHSKRTVKYSAVKPIFQRNCVSCHSGSKPAHGLDLTTYRMIMKGDKEGKVVVPRKAAQSRLSKAVHRKGATPMPPSQRLPAKEATIIDVWIFDGCPND